MQRALEVLYIQRTLDELQNQRALEELQRALGGAVDGSIEVVDGSRGAEKCRSVEDSSGAVQVEGCRGTVEGASGAVDRSRGAASGSRGAVEESR